MRLNRPKKKREESGEREMYLFNENDSNFTEIFTQNHKIIYYD